MEKEFIKNLNLCIILNLDFFNSSFEISFSDEASDMECRVCVADNPNASPPRESFGNRHLENSLVPE